jgi:hypothetical protein
MRNVDTRRRPTSLRRRIRRWLRHHVPLDPPRWQVILVVAALAVLLVVALLVG